MAAPPALILHGFTGNQLTVRRLGHLCDERGMPWRMPLLRGHGTVPEDLDGVTWQDWYADAEAELLAATAPGERALLMGLSMGGLVALDLAGRHPDRVCGIVTVAACLELAPPLLALLPVIMHVKPYWESSPPPRESAYPRFPTRTLASLVAYTRVMPSRLGRVTAPILIVQSWADETVKPRSARRIYDGVASRDKEIARFEHSEHEMLLGCESDAVVARIGAWLDLRLPDWSGIAAKSGS